MSRPITYREAYRGLRNQGIGIAGAAFCALVWVVGGVEIEE